MRTEDSFSSTEPTDEPDRDKVDMLVLRAQLQRKDIYDRYGYNESDKLLARRKERQSRIHQARLSWSKQKCSLRVEELLAKEESEKERVGVANKKPSLTLKHPSLSDKNQHRPLVRKNSSVSNASGEGSHNASWIKQYTSSSDIDGGGIDHRPMMRTKTSEVGKKGNNDRSSIKQYPSSSDMNGSGNHHRPLVRKFLTLSNTSGEGSYNGSWMKKYPSSPNINDHRYMMRKKPHEVEKKSNNNKSWIKKNLSLSDMSGIDHRPMMRTKTSEVGKKGNNNRSWMKKNSSLSNVFSNLRAGGDQKS